jgi:Holliday junction resolvase RusA-like endonuclease
MPRAQLAKPSVADRPFALPARELVTTVVDLPRPPSVNRTRRVDYSQSKLVRQWYEQADQMMMFIPRTSRQPVTGKFELHITLDENSVRCDADNVLKALIDYLRRVELITDDSPKYMRRLVVEWGQVLAGCRVTITELA